ncbi:MAG: glycosyltransferase family 4 protein [Anaerolineales bacterium]|nr:glycosyltransferase family 4 protein [Anaerolineae bacterium]PWB70766.1 MAG: glycosyltransferase family 4 protein [Anaerolineales bacterium]
MHIAFFTNFYLPVVNGVVRSVESFRKELSNQGHNVFVFAQTDHDYEDEAPFIFRYPSLSLPMQVNIPAVIPVSPFVDQLLHSLKLEVIHTHHPILLGQTAAAKADELNLPLVFTFHTQYREYTHYVPLPQEAIQEFLKDTVQNWLMDFMQKCQHIIVPSQSMADILVHEYGLRDHYTVIPTGIDLEPYRHADGEALRSQMGWQDDKVLISTGRLAPEKNWATLLNAAKKVHQKHPALRVVLIGDGPEKNALEELADELGIAERVTFTGAIPHSDVVTHLKAADIFGFASVTETQGLVTMEALAAGLPVVAVDASGTRDIIDDGEQGFLVRNDADALADSIDRVLDSPDAMQKFQDSALSKAREFGIENCTRKLVNVYRQAIQDKSDGKFVKIEELEGEQ